MNWGYADKTVVVTGVASGMGEALATLLVDDGAQVHGVDLRSPEQRLAATYQVDLADAGAVEDLVEALPAGIDAVFNCAGLAPTAPPEVVLRVNYIGLRRLTEGLLPRMAAGGAVAHIASKAANIWTAHRDELLGIIDIADLKEAEEVLLSSPAALANAYGFSKAAVVVYTMARAAELVPRGIRMNCTLPGNTDTPMLRDGFIPLMPEAIAALTALTGRESTALEQANALAFLNSDYASWVNGIALVVDGGSYGGVLTGRFEPPKIAAYTDRSTS